ncbi:MAG: hypothetical protein FJ278_20990 [Planctomycetes bacterium]|nr:hypothetical protein [Planctomycetota bacterium]
MKTSRQDAPTVRVLGRASLLVLCLMVSPSCQVARTPEPATTGKPPELAALLPQGTQLMGLKPKAEPKLYDESNLYEYIDGAAEAYLAYGFQRLVSARYGLPGRDSEIIMDIYQMPNLKNGFGIYSSLRSPEVLFVDIGTQAFLSEGTLDFWKDRYFIHIAPGDPDQAKELQLFVLHLGRAVANNIPGPVAEPEQVNLFPTRSLVPHSVKYVARDVFGQNFLTNAFIADYRLGEAKTPLFAAEYADAAKAKEALTAYKAYQAKAGKITSEDLGLGDSSFAADDPYYKGILAFTKSRFLCGALHVEDQKLVLPLLAELAAKLE